MRATSHRDLHTVRRSVERVRKLADRVIGIGPFGIGLDGVTAWIPGAGVVFSVVAGGMLMLDGVRARARPGVLAHMAALLIADSLTDLVPVPIAPAVVDMLFTGHKWASNVLLKHMDETIYYEGTREEAEADREFRDHLADLADEQRGGAPPRKRRIVYLHT